MVGKHLRAECGADAGRCEEIFVGDGQSMQRADVAASRHGRVGRVRRVARLICHDRDNGIHSRIELLDTFEMGVHDLPGRGLLASDGAGETSCGQIAQ